MPGNCPTRTKHPPIPSGLTWHATCVNPAALNEASTSAEERTVPRYRCVLTPAVNDNELMAMLPQRPSAADEPAHAAFEIAYEFSAPDMASVQRWLVDHSIPESSVTALEELPADS